MFNLCGNALFFMQRDLHNGGSVVDALCISESLDLRRIGWVSSGSLLHKKTLLYLSESLKFGKQEAGMWSQDGEVNVTKNTLSV